MINWNLRSYTESDFIASYNISKSSSDILYNLGLSKSGKSLNIIDETCEELGLPLLYRDVYTKITYTLDEILVENSPYKSTTNLKARLFSEGILEEKCSAIFCPFADNKVLNPFTGEETNLKLALDHINGNNSDNRLENLRILCTHCHSLTPTFCGANKVRKGPNRELPIDNLCKNCSIPISNQSLSGLCVICSNKSRTYKTKINWPDIEELRSMINEGSYTSVAKYLGVSDKSVRNRIKRYSSVG